MPQTNSSEGLLPGLSDPVLDQQSVFRAVLYAVSHPGSIVALPVRLTPPAPLDPSTAAVALTLADYETPLWLDAAAQSSRVSGYFRFHCGCPLTARPEEAAFAVVADASAMPPLGLFHTGSDEYPDRSTTLIIQLPSLDNGEAWTLRGPGIEKSTVFAPAGLPGDFRTWIADNRVLFPRGVDLIFTCGASLAALPRSTRLED
ncbi:phosphonate C-P lyase system protein PhnH [Telmatospirillum siberiense]|uniref:Phosphonate C-P lyase system protein PhnH n=1 Tax=Telmatospirillum siberiense TaxID=382514 RepID=A0A2N3Q166_9PROT|nr:phosphonate C-P lyase system protein PhnH [Telmatospirillum siberiense]PKU26399.1 phosphonate C-P lyase system protein PhnH [Telmatospirillum siberiense]